MSPVTVWPASARRAPSWRAIWPWPPAMTTRMPCRLGRTTGAQRDNLLAGALRWRHKHLRSAYVANPLGPGDDCHVVHPRARAPHHVKSIRVHPMSDSTVGEVLDGIWRWEAVHPEWT